MATYNKFRDFIEQVFLAKHNFDGSTHVFKVALSNTAPVNTNTILANITQISGTNGYTTGGTATTIAESETTGTITVTGTQVVFTASGGSMGPFQYVVLYNDTQTSPADALVAWWDHGSAVTLADTETYTVKFNNASPGTIFTAA
jgi:hypothetical protein